MPAVTVTCTTMFAASAPAGIDASAVHVTGDPVTQVQPVASTDVTVIEAGTETDTETGAAVGAVPTLAIAATTVLAVPAKT